MEQVHEGPGHEDVILSLSTPTADGGLLHRSWTVCACSALVRRIEPLLGTPHHQTVASRQAVEDSAAAVLQVPGAVHIGEGF